MFDEILQPGCTLEGTDKADVLKSAAEVSHFLD
jgi:hypothetical protein